MARSVPNTQAITLREMFPEMLQFGYRDPLTDAQRYSRGLTPWIFWKNRVKLLCDANPNSHAMAPMLPSLRRSASTACSMRSVFQYTRGHRKDTLKQVKQVWSRKAKTASHLGEILSFSQVLSHIRYTASNATIDHARVYADRIDHMYLLRNTNPSRLTLLHTRYATTLC
jgi:hypothetical protein